MMDIFLSMANFEDGHFDGQQSKVDMKCNLVEATFCQEKFPQTWK